MKKEPPIDLYPKNDLYDLYYRNWSLAEFSNSIVDTTKKATLEHLGYAINFCEAWEHCLDIGGGNGHYIKTLAQKFHKSAVLVEVQTLPEHATLTAQNPHLTVVHSMIEQYSTTTKFDFILLADLFEHIVDIETFVTKIASMQKTGGVLYIITPNPVTCGPAPESGIYHTRHENGHIKHYTEKEVCRLLAAHGYEHELTTFESTSLNTVTQRIILGLSRRDRRYSKFLLYTLIRPIVLIVAGIIGKIIESITYRNAVTHRFNRLTTSAQNMVFKKIV
jgi:2-polyprenyl-3-methyl-5-hydroxy-6-metoxy-1,4-benzoquinol methylase